MAKRRKKHRLPVWVRSQEFRLLNNSEKDFLGYLYSFGPNTCWLWNWRLAKKFHRTKRTIQRWLAKLKDLGFIWIEKPYGPERKLHARTLPSPEHWVKLIGALALARHTAKTKRPRSRRQGFPGPLHEHSSATTIKQARTLIINELVHRGETPELAAKVADQVISKQAKKKGLEG